MSYPMPIGIPNPGFGLDDVRPTRPDPWTSDVAGYYYVNNDTGTDSGRTYGNPTAPRATFPRPIPAGSYVEVHGTYDVASGGSTFIEGSGTSAAFAANSAGPVWVVGFDAATRPTFTLPTVIYGSYVYVEHIKWTALAQVGSSTAGRPVDHITVRHCENEGDGITTRSGFTCEGSSVDPVAYVVFYDNLVHGLGDMSSGSDLDCLAFTTGAFCNHAWVLSNEWHTVFGGSRAGSASIGADPANSQWLYWGDNYIHDCKQNGLALKYGKNVVFSQNTVERITDNGGALSPGKAIGTQYKPDGCWILFNRISECRYGIHGSSTDSGGPWNVYVIGNIITDCGTTGAHDGGSTSEAAIMFRATYAAYVLNNTLEGNDVHFTTSGGASSLFFLENNIFGTRTTDLPEVYVENSPDNCTIANCLFHDSAGVEIRWGSGTVYNSLAAFQAGESNGVACLDADPLLAANLSLTASSPCIGAASPTLISTLDSNFLSTFGEPISFDFAGSVRPYDGSWDIGAYEYVSGVMNITTLNATTLTVG